MKTYSPPTGPHTFERSSCGSNIKRARGENSFSLTSPITLIHPAVGRLLAIVDTGTLQTVDDGVLEIAYSTMMCRWGAVVFGSALPHLSAPGFSGAVEPTAGAHCQSWQVDRRAEGNASLSRAGIVSATDVAGP